MSTQTCPISQRLELAKTVAVEAGCYIVSMLNQRQHLNIECKNLNDFVSIVDKHTEEMIIKRLTQAFPEDSILAEESGLAYKSHNQYTWIIDPLDGTTNFLRGYNHFAISIALKQDNQLIVGIIYNPISKELFSARAGHGAYLNSEAIRISNKPQLHQSVIATGFTYKSLARLEHYLESLRSIISHVTDMRRLGSAALDLAYVACGRFDGYWEMDLMPWDIAAGILLVREAGGECYNFSGKQQLLQNGDIIAGSIAIVADIQQIISQYSPIK